MMPRDALYMALSLSASPQPFIVTFRRSFSSLSTRHAVRAGRIRAAAQMNIIRDYFLQDKIDTIETTSRVHTKK